MPDFEKNEYVHYPPFRPALRGCVGRDRRLAASVYTCCSEAFFGISDNIYRSLALSNADSALADLFEELAEQDLERLRLLEELYFALLAGEEQDAPRCPRFKRTACPAYGQDPPALVALWERRRNIDCFETLMGRTEDRVVHSVFSKLLTAERVFCRRLEKFVNG